MGGIFLVKSRGNIWAFLPKGRAQIFPTLNPNVKKNSTLTWKAWFLFIPAAAQHWNCRPGQASQPPCGTWRQIASKGRPLKEAKNSKGYTRCDVFIARNVPKISYFAENRVKKSMFVVFSKENIMKVGKRSFFPTMVRTFWHEKPS